jgi:hypothetical protein
MAGHGETPKKIGRIDRSSYHEVGATEAIRTSFTVTLKRAHGDDEDTKVQRYEAVVSSAAGRVVFMLFFVSSILRFFDVNRGYVSARQ